MIKKFKKFQNLRYYELKGYLEGHMFAYGRIGGGKSVSLLSVIQGYHDNYGYKIFDLYGGARNEQVYWAIPSQDFEYWNKKVASIGRFDEKAPKQYKVNFLYPCFTKYLPKKLPKKIVDGKIIVNSKIFTIPLKDILIDDVATVIGIVSESNRYYWNELLQKSFKQDNSGSLIHLSSKVKGLVSTTLFKNFILPLSRNHFIMDSYCEKNIDLIGEARDSETISVLCLDFVPKVFHAFVINWIARRLTEELDKNKVPKKNILFIREAANFFKATDDSVLDDRLKIFRSNMADYIRMGRRGMYFALDCQSASETKGLVQGCLSENTIIKGYDKKLVNMPDNFPVNSYNIKKDKIEKDYAKKIYSGEKECYEIEFEDGKKVIATNEHRFFDKNKKEIQVKDLNVGDELIFINQK